MIYLAIFYVTLSYLASTVPISIAPATHSTVTNITTLPSLAPKDATPVIANVISLSNATNGQSSVLGSAALQGTFSFLTFRHQMISEMRA